MHAALKGCSLINDSDPNGHLSLPPDSCWSPVLLDRHPAQRRVRDPNFLRDPKFQFGSSLQLILGALRLNGSPSTALKNRFRPNVPG